MRATIHQDTRTAKQLANDYSKARSHEATAQSIEDMQRAHDAAAAVWQEARARAGKDWAMFRRITQEQE